MNFDSLHEDYQHFFADVKSTKPGCDVVFFMSFDAEWYERDGRNVVLSYQIATAAQDKTKNIIKYTRRGKRLTLAQIVELGIKSVTTDDSFKELRNWKVQVVLISHNVAAEWSVLADRDEPHIMKRLALVRTSPITDGHRIKIEIDNSTPVGVRIFDTMLLAPASHRSLKKLSALLGSEGSEKLYVSQFHIENMNIYLRDNPDEFEEYALRDSEITLMLFFLIQESLNKLVEEKDELEPERCMLALEKFKLFRTLASAGVKSFTDKKDWYANYKEALLDKFTKPYQLVKRSYYGGRNEGYFIGRTKNYPETKDKIWIDIDFTGCYPTAMALCPKIDTEKEADIIPSKCIIDDIVAAELKKDNVPPEIIAEVSAALEESQEAFDKVMMDGKLKKLYWRIRQKATVINNRLVNSWYDRWQKAKKEGDKSIEKVSIPGFARVRFKFPKGTQFPSLPIRHPEYGLLYVLEGETVVPAIEIMLAMDAGAKIEALTSIEFTIKKDKKGDPDRFVLKHLSKLATKRTEYKKKYKDDPDRTEAEVMQRLLKEFTNAFYGKFSQSINPRNVYRPATGELVTLGESSITEPITAALVTSLARAALSAVLIAVERFNKNKTLHDQITVISATTDGLLIGVPTPEDFTVANKYYKLDEEEPSKFNKKFEDEGQLKEILGEFGCGELMEEMDEFLPIRQMRNARYEMTKSNEILEIKHIADEIISIKTRGQTGFIATGETVLLARFNLKPPLSEIIERSEIKQKAEVYKEIMEAGGVVKDSRDSDWILEHLDATEAGRDDIVTYPFITLNSFTKMAKSGGKLDLTKNINARKINTDFDWKRKLEFAKSTTSKDDVDKSNVSPFTVPYLNAAEMVAHRNTARSIRNTGKVARPVTVLQRITDKGGTTRFRGGEPVTLARTFLRGILHGKIPLTSEIGIYQHAAEKVNAIWKQLDLCKAYHKTWTVNDFKNAKRGKWNEPSRITPNIILNELVKELAKGFDADLDKAEKVIFNAEEFKRVNSALMEYAITAIAKAPRMEIPPFHDLYKKGLLPDRQKIIDTFRNQLSEQQLEACFNTAFTPGKQPAHNADSLKRIFYRLGIPNVESVKCARSLAPPSQVVRGKRRNPGEKKCVDHFAMALQQDDISNREMNVSDVLLKLKRYGLTKTKYYQLKKGRFNPNCIKDTSQNRQQINRMARDCGHDPLPLIDVLIEK